MNKLFSFTGYLILVFIIISNYINISLTDMGVIILGIISAVFMSVGILLKDKKHESK